MGNYNYQYQKYYSNLLNGNKTINNNDDFKSIKKKTLGEKILRRLFQEVMGLILLTSLTIVCKQMYDSNYYARTILGYAKEVVKFNFDYNKFSADINGLNTFQLSKATKKW